MKNKKGIVIIGIMIVFIAIFSINGWQKSVKKEEAFDKCKQDAKGICEEQGVLDVDIKISYSQKYEEYDVYMLTVNGTFEDIPLGNIYKLVKSVDSLMIDYDDTLLLTTVNLNNKVYALDTLNEKELTCDDVVVYTYVSETEKSMKETLKDKLPYEGLKEEYIGYTKLGEPEKDFCRDYTKLQERARYITYTWRDGNGNKIAEATVRHWDFETKKYVEGYISDMWFSSKYSN